jgi:hypothetical protein
MCCSISFLDTRPAIHIHIHIHSSVVVCGVVVCAAEELAKDCGIDVVVPIAKVEGGAAAANILKFSA